jgi:hypothetical protein
MSTESLKLLLELVQVLCKDNKELQSELTRLIKVEINKKGL